MSRRSDNFLILIILAVCGAIYWILKSIWEIVTKLFQDKASSSSPSIVDAKTEKEKYWEERGKGTGESH